MPTIESIDGKKKKIKCIGCAIQNGIIKRFGPKVAETKNFDVQQDYEIPIPGFMILASKKHHKGVEDFSKEERIELIEFLHKIRKSMSKILKVKYVYIVQEEDSLHFHIWLLPRYKWMDKFGKGIESVRPIMEYARKSMKTKHNLKKVLDDAIKLRKYLSKNQT